MGSAAPNAVARHKRRFRNLFGGNLAIESFLLLESPLRRLPLSGLVFAATSLCAAWGAPAIHDVITKDGVEVSILPTIAPAGGSGAIVGVALDVEARTDAAARRLGFRSLHAVTMVDCRSRANHLVAAETFEAAELTGRGHVQPVSDAWVRPAANSYMSAVTDQVCAGADLAAAPAQVIKVTLGAEQAAARPPAAIAPVAPAALGSPASTSRLEAQVAASRTAQAAQKVLGSLKTLIAPPLTASVQLALVRNRQFYRASVGGFASLASARAFCVQATRVTGQCWVRQAAPLAFREKR